MANITGWIVYPATKCSMDQNSYEWIISQAELNGIKLTVLFEEEIVVVIDKELSINYRGKKLTKPDFAIVRSYNFTLMSQLECMKIKLFNSSHAMNISLNKALSHQCLQTKNIPTIKTIYNCKDYSFLSSTLKEPFIAKYTNGNRGKEVFIVHNQKEFAEICSKYDSIISQEFIEESSGKDIRVWVVAGKAVAGVLRYNDNSFKSNFSLGGSAKAIEITPSIAKIAIESTKAVGLDFAGVDLLITDKGYLVCEINGNAAFRTLSTVSKDNNIPFELFKFINSFFEK